MRKRCKWAKSALTPVPPYLGRLDDPVTVEALAIQNAAEALIGLGWPVEPKGDDFEAWKLGDLISGRMTI